MTKDELQRAMRAHLATLDPECKWYMPDLISTKNKSENQNAYLWTLCQRIAEKLHSTKEEVYQEAVRKKGVFDFVLVVDKALDNFIKSWNSKGLGWHAEATTNSKINGATKVICYYGTSVYNKDQERTLIDYIVEEAKELGIETLTENELRQMGVIA
jgi:hypothetical protein